MVIAFVGAGSYVFGPSVLVQLLNSGLENVELRLIDPNMEAISPLAAAAQAESDRRKRNLTFSVHDHFEGALSACDAVIHSAAPGLRSDFERDSSILAATYPEHLITEFGGVHGIAYSVRQVQFTRDLANQMITECPDAWLLASANPLPRVCTVAERIGIRTMGFCSVAMVAYREIGRRLFGLESEYPFTEITSQVSIATAGTNHLSWVVELRDRATGDDLLPVLRATAYPDTASKTERYLHRTGYLLAPGDDHIQDFLPVDGGEPGLGYPSHGTPEDRERRRQLLDQIVAGSAPFASLDDHPAWEFPIAALESLKGGPAVDLVTLNIPNRGQIPELPIGAVVETPCRVTASGAEPRKLSLPKSVVGFNQIAVEITEAIVSAVLDDDTAQLQKAVDLDLTISDKAGGWAALQACLEL